MERAWGDLRPLGRTRLRAQPARLPVSNEEATPDGRGRFNNFQHGSITYTFATGTTTVTYS